MRTTSTLLVLACLAAALPAACSTDLGASSAPPAAALTEAEKLQLLRDTGQLYGVGGEVPEAQVNVLRDRYSAVITRIEARAYEADRSPCVAGPDREADPCYRAEHPAYEATAQFAVFEKTRAAYNRALVAIAAAEAFANRYGM